MNLIRRIYKLFLSKQKQKAMEQKTTEVVLTCYSQSHVLQQRMREEKLTHGERVTANLNPVRLESNFGKMVMYFCPMQEIEVTNRLEKGDAGAIPSEAILEGLEVPANLKSGLYNLKNVELFSNGTMQVIATEKTLFEDFDMHHYEQQQQIRQQQRAVCGASLAGF